MTERDCFTTGTLIEVLSLTWASVLKLGVDIVVIMGLLFAKLWSLFGKEGKDEIVRV